MKKTLLGILFILVPFFFFGCASTSIAAQKRTVMLEPIKSLDISVLNWKSDKDPASSMGAYGINETVQDTIPLLRKRLPIVLEENGLEVISSDAQYKLLLIPSKAKHQSYGGHVQLYMIAVIKDTTTNSILWQATLRFSRPGFSIVNDEVIDTFVKTIIIQLERDGMIVREIQSGEKDEKNFAQKSKVKSSVI